MTGTQEENAEEGEMHIIIWIKKPNFFILTKTEEQGKKIKSSNKVY